MKKMYPTDNEMVGLRIIVSDEILKRKPRKYHDLAGSSQKQILPNHRLQRNHRQRQTHYYVPLPDFVLSVKL